MPPPRKARSPFCPEAPAYRKHNGVLACELRVDGGIVVSCYLRSGHSDERVSLYRPACTKCSPLMGQPVRVFWISIPLAWCSLLCDLGTSASPSCHPSGSRTFCFLCGPFSCLIPACASRGSLAFFFDRLPYVLSEVLASSGKHRRAEEADRWLRAARPMLFAWPSTCCWRLCKHLSPVTGFVARPA